MFSERAYYPIRANYAVIVVIPCMQVIGWRSNARHLLIYITDAGFHHAADGYVSVWLQLSGTVCVCVCVHMYMLVCACIMSVCLCVCLSICFSVCLFDCPFYVPCSWVVP